MNLFELFVKIGVDDQASGKLKDLGGKLGNGLKTAAKIGTAAVGAAAAGITALTTAAVNNYAEYEQLVGGAELMFGKAFGTVQKNAQEAYRTVQMSQNEYLQQVNGFATGLKTALKGNEKAAADLAHKIIKAEADIVAATGNTKENVQNAFNGIMKSNFTMLDNLQIGITPTKEGFQEVINKVNDWNKANGKATKYQMGNLADMQSALVDYIEMQGLAGYASKEAANTISGSLASAKSAWTNLITGLADGNADIGGLIDNLVTTIVGDGTEANLGVIGNILPAIERALGGAVKLIEGAAPKIIEILPGLVEKILPSLISSATDMVGAFTDVLPSLLSTVIDAIISNGPMLIDAAVGLIDALITAFDDNYEMIIEGAGKIIEHLVSGLVSLLPKILETGLNVLVSLADGIAENIDTLIPTIVDVVLKIVDVLTQSDVLQNLLDAAFVIIDKLSTSIMEATPEVTDAIMLIIEEIVSVLLKPENLAKLVTTAINLIVAIASGLISAIPEIVAGIGEVIDSVVQEWKDTDWKKIGKDVLTGLWNGISDKVSWLKRKVSGVVDKIKGWFTGSSGFDTHSPSKWSAKVFRNVMDGGVVGLEDGLPDLMGGVDDVVGRVKDGMTIDGFGGGISYGHSSGFGGTSIGNITINIDGAKYSDEQSLATAVAEAIQNMTDRRAAVYA